MTNRRTKQSAKEQNRAPPCPPSGKTTPGPHRWTKSCHSAKHLTSETCSCWERSPYWEPRFHSSCGACTAANGSPPACKPSWWRLPQPAKACWYGCESEADIVSTAIKGEYGNWSDTLRKAFDQDRLSYNRRTEVKNRGMADKGMLFAEMPQEFTRQELLEKAKEKGISRNSTLCWLQRWKKKGVVTCTGVPGTYIKK